MCTTRKVEDKILNSKKAVAEVGHRASFSVVKEMEREDLSMLSRIWQIWTRRAAFESQKEGTFRTNEGKTTGQLVRTVASKTKPTCGYLLKMTEIISVITPPLDFKGKSRLGNQWNEYLSSTSQARGIILDSPASPENKTGRHSPALVKLRF